MAGQVSDRDQLLLATLPTYMLQLCVQEAIMAVQGRWHRSCQMHAVLILHGKRAVIGVCGGTCSGRALVRADGPCLCVQVHVGT